MKHTINGRRYEVKYTDSIPDDECGLLAGLCDPPQATGKTIHIRNGLPLDLLIDTLIHEAMHGALWELSEDFVEVFATDLSQLLIKELGMKEAQSTGE